MKTKTLIVASMLALAATPALGGKTVAIAPENLDALQSLDEVTVEGDPSLSAARIAVQAAEDRFYRRWNNVNKDPKFDITCGMQTPGDHPSRIARRVCQPMFIERIAQDAAQRTMAAMQGSMGSQGGVVNVGVSEAEAMQLQRELRQRTLEALRKDPALQRALVEHARLAQHYEELRKEKFKDRWIVWD